MHKRGEGTIHMSEAEVARDLHAVLEKVRQGVAVVIEHGGSGFEGFSASRANDLGSY
jgi:hypothetical protein